MGGLKEKVGGLKEKVGGLFGGGGGEGMLAPPLKLLGGHPWPTLFLRLCTTLISIHRHIYLALDKAEVAKICVFMCNNYVIVLL